MFVDGPSSKQCHCFCLLCFIINQPILVTLQIISNNNRYTQFLFQLSDLGCQLQVARLRDTARAVLKLMPAGRPHPLITNKEFHLIFHFGGILSLFELQSLAIFRYTTETVFSATPL